MYKDKDKQREANRRAKARQRAKKGMTAEGMTSTACVIPEQGGKCKYCGVELDHPKLVCCGPCAWSRKGYLHKGGRPDFQCRGAVLTGGYQLTPYEREHYKPANQLSKGEHNPVSKPGDADYEGVCQSTGGLLKVETPQAGGGVENDK